MKVIQLEDEPFLPTPCRTTNLNKLEEDVPSVIMAVTEEYQRQNVKQKQP